MAGPAAAALEAPAGAMATCGGAYCGVADGGEDVHLARGRLATAVHGLGGDHGLTLLMDGWTVAQCDFQPAEL